MKRLLNNIKKLDSKNKTKVVSLLIVLLLLVVTSISYAFYMFSVTQNGENEISSACFKITLEGKNDISLTDTVPLTDEEGNKLVPYEFTIKNVCKMAANYQINIETLNESTLETLYLRSKINDDSSVILGEQEEVDTYINDNVKESRKISEGLLLENESVTYRLRVWVDNDSTVEQSSNKNWVGKVVVTALMNKNPYRTITLNANGGELNSTSMEVVEGRVVGELPIPMRLGYVFNGWFTEEENGEQITEFTIINKNQEVYAHWNKGKYDLVVNPNEGEWDTYTSSQTYHLDYEEEKEINDPVRTGYHFTNWTLEGQESSINNKVFKMGYENATLTANYEKNSYKLNVVDTYGRDEEVNLLYEEEKTIENPTREGYTFTGWEVEGNGSTIENNTFKMGYEDATLRAQWEANDYPYIALHYQENINDNNYTLVDADTEEGNLPYGTKKTPSVKTYTGFTSPQAKEITIEVDTYPPTKNKVEYQYSRNKYSITINPNEGTYNSSTTNTVINDIKYQKETTINDPTRVGYTFNGWTKSGNATLTNKVLTMGSENVTLTAGWTINTYTISYNANGGNVTPGSATVNHGSTLTLPTPTREGYEFLGWYTESSGGTQVSNTTQWTSSQTIYAQWKENNTLTLNANGGSVSPTSKSMAEGETYTLPTPTRAHYRFDGWYTAASGGTAIGSTYTMGSSNSTIYAHWTQTEYQLTAKLTTIGYSTYTSYGSGDGGTIMTISGMSGSWQSPTSSNNSSTYTLWVPTGSLVKLSPRYGSGAAYWNGFVSEGGTVTNTSVSKTSSVMYNSAEFYMPSSNVSFEIHDQDTNRSGVHADWRILRVSQGNIQVALRESGKYLLRVNLTQYGSDSSYETSISCSGYYSVTSTADTTTVRTYSLSANEVVTFTSSYGSTTKWHYLASSAQTGKYFKLTMPSYDLTINVNNGYDTYARNIYRAASGVPSGYWSVSG